jgi:membrane protease YdiL (CAAX protease family)
VSEWTKPLKPFDVLRRLAAGALILGVIVSADPQTRFLRASSEAVPPGALRLTLTVLLIATFYFWGGLFNGRRLRFANHAPVTVTGRPKLRRAPHPAGSNALQWQLMLCGWLAFLAYPEQWTWSTVGLKTEVPVAISAGIGFIAYAVLVALLTAVIHFSGVAGLVLDGTVRSMAALIPRGRGQKAMAWIAFCVFNPVIEELLFRGVLIYQTSLVIGSPWLPIAAGLVVNIGNHWYQGRRSMLLHIPFFAIAVGLLFSPLGLAGAIGFHIAGDIVPMSLMRRQMRQFRARHRNAGVANVSASGGVE